MKTWLRARQPLLGLPHLLFALVLLLRLSALARLSGSPLFLPLRGDMHFYNDWAIRILRGETGGPAAFYGLPGYAYLLAFLYKIAGYNPFVPGLFQAILDAGVAVLIYTISVSIMALSRSASSEATNSPSQFINQNAGRIVGAIAGFGWAIFPPAQAYSVVLMPTIWFVFVFWFVVWRIVHHSGRLTGKEYLLLGLLIGMTATAVATVLALVPMVFAALLLPLRTDRKIWLGIPARAGLFTVGIIFGTSPCWIHNYFLARDPVFLSAHSGINLWIGNHPGAIGYPRFPPGLRAGQAAMLQDSITQAEAAAGRSLKRAEISAYWSGKAKDYVASHPGEWLRLLARKIRNFWSAFQYDDLSIITVLREEGVIFGGLSFGVVAAAGIPGMVLAWRRAPRSRWVAAAVLLLMFALLPVFVTERYRLAAVPGLLVFAAFGLSVLWCSLARNRLLIAGGYLALLAGSATFVSWPERDPSLWALDSYNSGWQALESNNLGLAEKKLALAYSYVPDNPETLFALGNLRLAQKDPDAAESFYGAVLAIDSKHKGALNNLGVLAFDREQYADAEDWFRRAAVVDPGSAKVHYLLAKALLRRGKREEAEAETETALRVKPDQREFQLLEQEIKAQPH